MPHPDIPEINPLPLRPSPKGKRAYGCAKGRSAHLFAFPRPLIYNDAYRVRTASADVDEQEMRQAMRIHVNGKEHVLSDEASLKEVVDRLCPDPERVITELNGAIVERGAWDRTRLHDGDRLELVTFVGGG